MGCRYYYCHMPFFTLKQWAILGIVGICWLPLAKGMRESQLGELRTETEHMFYHGFENYMKYAFPEDELRPISCRPLTRDKENPAHVELNDVLGNYSLTLVDSLSTLAILASRETESRNGRKAWGYFQEGVQNLVELYGDGSDGPSGRGSRGKGFETDSKVQVFETVIRGLGGLLSAHLFAVGDLPIRGYHPPEEEANYAKYWTKPDSQKGSGIRWENGFIYNGQLLRLAMDLGTRLLPAFYTETGIPYPRVNLRSGIPFYKRSPLNTIFSNSSQSNIYDYPPEVTETCSAGAGSLVLEFTVLSRLTGDGRFEEFAKRAYWAVWDRRSNLGLIGSGIDAESGRWVTSFTGIGAGIDSFFEYAIKTHILLSEGHPPAFNSSNRFQKFDSLFPPLTDEDHSADSFLRVWQESFDSIKHHLYRGPSYQYPHFIQGDIITGAIRAFWMDSLSAYFPGLLTLAGNVEEAAEAHLLNTALWTRFSALPERWNVATGEIEGGLGWWGGRPEFVESTYYLYRATKDPWYLHVGEMAIRDIKRRCWTRCGWAGLQDVRSGDLSDRMESFFLGETTKYLYLLFDTSHPLNHLDAPFVFSTEGHPLIIPKGTKHKYARRTRTKSGKHPDADIGFCQPAPMRPLFSVSSTAARPDIFHAANLARLHLMPPRQNIESPVIEYTKNRPSTTLSDLFSPSNYTYFPWTLPLELVPYNATSAPMAARPTLDLTFPPLPNDLLGPASLERIRGGIIIKSVGGLRLGMVQDVPLFVEGNPSSIMDGYRIQVVNNVPLGKDEKVYITQETTDILNPSDPNFKQILDLTMLDIIIHTEQNIHNNSSSTSMPLTSQSITGTDIPIPRDTLAPAEDGSDVRFVFSSLVNHVTSLLREESSLNMKHLHSLTSQVSIPAITSAGKGSAPLPENGYVKLQSIASSSNKATKRPAHPLPWSSIYLADECCGEVLPSSVPLNHQVIVMKRGGCSFSEKLKRIPSFRPSRASLQLVIVVSYSEPVARYHTQSGDPARFQDYSSPPSIPPFAPLLPDFDESRLIRPLLDELQVVAGGVTRPYPISMVMVGGGDQAYENIRNAQTIGIRRRYEVKSQGVPVGNLIIL